MSLTRIVNNANSAIKTNIKAFEVVQGNITNIDNPAYAKGRISITPDTSIANTLSVPKYTVDAVRNPFIDKEIVRSHSTNAYYEQTCQDNKYLENFLGETFAVDMATDRRNSNNGFGSAIGKFFEACHSVSSDTTSTTKKIELIEKTKFLTDKFHKLKAQLGRFDNDIDARMQQNADEANNWLSKITECNQQLAKFENLKMEEKATEFREERQFALEELSKICNFEVQTSANSPKFQIIAKDTANNDVVILEDSTVNTTFQIAGGNVQCNGTDMNIESGRLAADLKSKASITNIETDLNNWVDNFVQQVNVKYNPTSAPGENFFDPAGVEIGTINLLVDESTLLTSLDNTNYPLSNDRILQVAELTADTNVGLGARTFSESYADFVAKHAERYNGDTQKYSDIENAHNLLLQAREKISGISVDREMVDLMQAQRVFQANAQIIHVAKVLFDAILNATTQ